MDKILKDKLRIGFKNNTFETMTGWNNNYEIETTLSKRVNLFIVQSSKNGARPKVFKTFDSALNMFLNNVNPDIAIELTFFDSWRTCFLSTLDFFDKEDITINLKSFLKI
tara:strand:+ start:1226 stop:1555 length:330 start_codon:yes stop_codon:yes gene_type:complete